MSPAGRRRGVLRARWWGAPGRAAFPAPKIEKKCPNHVETSAPRRFLPDWRWRPGQNRNALVGPRKLLIQARNRFAEVPERRAASRRVHGGPALERPPFFCGEGCRVARLG